MLKGIWREIRYLLEHKWDLCLVTLAPLFLIVLFGSMFYSGKAEHLPVAVIDQDHSQLSHTIQRFLGYQHAIDVHYVTDQSDQVEHLLNQTEIWGYIHIPAGAEQRLVQTQDPQISIAYNQSFYSIGNTISTAMSLGTLQGIAAYTGTEYLQQSIPYIDVPTPNVKISTLYNPSLSYEFYLEPFIVPAILHLLLCCCVAFSVGQELKQQHDRTAWVNQGAVLQAILSKNLLYVLIFCLWTWAWMFWLVSIRGWFVAGEFWLILLAQFLFYLAYALISTTMVLATKNLSKTFGLIAVYGGSSLSFAGVTLPLNNAPLFTRFWANIIPYTPYAKLQTEQWVVGSPLLISLKPLLLISVYVLIYIILAALLLKRMQRKNQQ